MFLPVSEVDSLPVILKEESVSWPRVAIQSHRKGIVIVQATVDSGGVVEDAKILRTDDDGFGIPEAVLKAVREYRFKPATKNGIRVKTYFTVTKRYAFRER
jgi:TonB family protein